MWQKSKNTLIYWAVRTSVFCVRILPRAWALAVGGFLGTCFHVLVSRERKRALNHLRLAFPDMTQAKQRVIVRKMFSHLGRNLLEFFRMQGWSSRKIISLVEKAEGVENMEAARARGLGVLCLTAHLGNWEILPIFTQQQGWHTAVVAQVLYDPRLDEILNNFREAHSLLVVRRKQMTRDIIRCLKGNYLLGILNDQDTGVDSRFAPFFGRLAKTPVGIFRLARKLGTPVVPIFIARHATGRNRIYIEPALTLPFTDNEEDDLLQSACLGNQVIEKYVRQFPEQWVWFHQRWKSKAEAKPE